MTYAEQADTTNDPEFVGRVMACASEQAAVFVNDDRPEFSELAERVIANQTYARGLVPLVVAKPGINTGSGDPDILAAVQAVWPVYGATLIPDA